MKTISVRELIREVNKTGSFYFNKGAMTHFGDSVKNYGVREFSIGDKLVWELYRKSPVLYGLQQSVYFDKITFTKVYL